MNKNIKETVQIEEDKNVSKKSKKDLKAENVKVETNIEVSSNDVTETKTELTPIEKNVESTQLSFTSKAAQKEHVKNMKLKFEQETVIEKERIEAERARLKQAIIDIQAEIEKSKIKSVKVWEQAKFEEAKLIEEAIKNKKLEEEELRKRHDLLKQRQNDIALLNQQHAQKDVKFREEFAAKKADAVQKIKLAKLQIKEELEAQRRAVKQRELEQVAMAIELKQRLKEEKMELERQKLEEKRAFKQEVAQMKLELFACYCEC